MGLTKSSTGAGAIKEMFQVKVESGKEMIVALAGNPNTGKSTVFNQLTGLNQHTGNWPGKTVTSAQGKFTHGGNEYILVDLPGTYSLLANSVEEQVARDFICFGQPHATIVVTDATCLERNLNLVLQILEIDQRVILCVNLMDEAKRKGIHVDLGKLSVLLGIPVVGTSARSGIGLDELKDILEGLVQGRIKTSPIPIQYDGVLEEAVGIIEPYIRERVGDGFSSKWMAMRLIDGDATLLDSMAEYTGYHLSKDQRLKELMHQAQEWLEERGISLEILGDLIVANIVERSERIRRQVVTMENKGYRSLDVRIDNILTSKKYGIPIMILLLGLIFWITIEGANVPSMLLAEGLFWLENQLSWFFHWMGSPAWLHDLIVLGIYRTLAWVVSVMLPPMAIFFPIFTLLEDLGYLPRVAFNLDHYFKKACAHGKQALTMCMGFGCNAAGVIACRIIDSPRERLIATITNNFVPCNGRFPLLIAMSSMFIAKGVGPFRSIGATLTILLIILLGVSITLAISRILSKTILKGLPSSFTLELPPYRKPQVGRIIIRSIFDRTLFVLGRAVAVAAPAGVVIWGMANLTIGGASLLTLGAGFLDPFARLIGLDGYILMAFILGFPANEIVIPILIMSYLAEGAMLDLSSLDAMKQLFLDHGWTWLTAICMMLFSLNHWPCGTTLWTIRKETQSWKWTIASFMVPTITGIILCFIVAQGARWLGLA